MDRLEKIAGLDTREIISVIAVFSKVNEARLRVDRLMSKRDFLVMILNKISEQIDEELIKYKKTQDELEEYIKTDRNIPTIPRHSYSPECFSLEFSLPIGS